MCLYFICFCIFLELILMGLGKFYSRTPKLDQLGDDTYNIVCLGDSFTYGWAVDLKDTYPGQLESLLNEKQFLNKKWKVYNLGIPGYNSSQVLHLFEDIVKKYKNLHAVIVLTGANDSWNMAQSNIYHLPRYQKHWALSRKVKLFFANRRIYKMVKVIVLNFKGQTFESNEDVFRTIIQYEGADVGVLRQLLEYNLGILINLAKEHDVKVILHNYPRGDIHGVGFTQSMSKKYAVPYVDNYGAFNNRLINTRFSDLFLYDNSHPNKEGYEIMAEGLYAVLIKLFK